MKVMRGIIVFLIKNILGNGDDPINFSMKRWLFTNFSLCFCIIMYNNYMLF